MKCFAQPYPENFLHISKDLPSVSELNSQFWKMLDLRFPDNIMERLTFEFFENIQK